MKYPGVILRLRFPCCFHAQIEYLIPHTRPDNNISHLQELRMSTRYGMRGGRITEVCFSVQGGRRFSQFDT